MKTEAKQGMTVAREIADFVSGQRYADLPPKAIEYAEMLISSTVASAALGSTIDSSKIVRAMEVERGGKADATCGDERKSMTFRAWAASRVVWPTPAKNSVTR